MTEQEEIDVTIKILKQSIRSFGHDYFSVKMKWFKNISQEEIVFKNAIIALEKQKKKKVIKATFINNFRFYCQECMNPLCDSYKYGEANFEYCPMCGQHLDWMVEV